MASLPQVSKFKLLIDMADKNATEIANLEEQVRQLKLANEALLMHAWSQEEARDEATGQLIQSVESTNWTFVRTSKTTHDIDVVMSDAGAREAVAALAKQSAIAYEKNFKPKETEVRALFASLPNGADLEAASRLEPVIGFQTHDPVRSRDYLDELKQQNTDTPATPGN